MRHLIRYGATCWVCLGKGVVAGPIHSAPCPNPNCAHRESEAR